jgi:hypothetical protein
VASGTSLTVAFSDVVDAEELLDEGRVLGSSVRCVLSAVDRSPNEIVVSPSEVLIICPNESGAVC